jgi:DNA polymerase I-like protein with 3'-5' exonuclease and polymerase domains
MSRKLRKEFNFDIWSTPQIGHWMTEQGILVPKTPKGNYSVTKDFLEQHTDTRLNGLKNLRQINRLRKVFIEDGIVKGHHKGRIHASFVQVARDDGGVRNGRFSCKQPNLQQVPKRSDLGKLIRALYLAEEGMLWAKPDYSSQEPRLQVHYALILNLAGSEEALQALVDGIKIYTFLEKATGLDYDTCKMLVLGLGYGMGVETMSDKLGVSETRCSEIRDQFKEKAPYLSLLFDRCRDKAEDKGFLKTLLGRRARFDWWSSGYDGKPIKGREAALRAYPNQMIERQFTFKAMNALIQGGSGDQVKKAMVLGDEAGVDIRLPVHDEVCSMVYDEKGGLLMKEIMEHAVELKVPTVVDLDLGPSWQ